MSKGKLLAIILCHHVCDAMIYESLSFYIHNLRSACSITLYVRLFVNNKVLFVFLTECAAFMIIWIRYRHIKGHYADSPAKLQLLNVLSLLAGFLSVFGLLLVGSFQVSRTGG